MSDGRWVYQWSKGGGVYTVGFHADGEWHPESDHNTSDEAAERVRFLNGGNRAPDGVGEPVAWVLEFRDHRDSNVWRTSPVWRPYFDEATAQTVAASGDHPEMIRVRALYLHPDKP